MAPGGSIAERRKRAPVPLAVQETAFERNTAGYTIDDDGAFTEGDISMSRAGISFATAPQTTAPVSQPLTIPLSALPLAVAPNTPEYASSPKIQAPLPLSQIVEDEIRDTRFADLRVIRQLGRGSGGVVQCVLYKPRRRLMAMKVIPLDVTDQVRKQILLELRTLYQAQSPHIVRFYGGFFTDGHIQICLELMDVGSLEMLSKQIGPFPEPVLASVASQVLRGLVYLHKEKKLVHRDIKPSNILINSKGEVKISDFGVSGQLASSISSCVSWVGTVTYMSPERIQGKSYTVQSDIWSFGLSIVELALGHFPYRIPSSEGGPAPSAPAGEGIGDFGFWELLSLIVEQDTPGVPASTYSSELQDFCRDCLQKNPNQRRSAVSLLEHAFINKYAANPVDMAAWVEPYVVKNEEDQAALAQTAMTPMSDMGSPIPRHLIPQTHPGSAPSPFALGTPPNTLISRVSSSSSSESVGTLPAANHSNSSSRDGPDRSSSRSSSRDQETEGRRSDSRPDSRAEGDLGLGQSGSSAAADSTRSSLAKRSSGSSFINRFIKSPLS